MWESLLRSYPRVALKFLSGAGELGAGCSLELKRRSQASTTFLLRCFVSRVARRHSNSPIRTPLPRSNELPAISEGFRSFERTKTLHSKLVLSNTLIDIRTSLC